MNTRLLLTSAAIAGLFLAGCVAADDDGGGTVYADPGFYGEAWYDSGPYYVHPPYGHGDWDRDQHWHETQAGHDEHHEGAEHARNQPEPARPRPQAQRPVPSIPNRERPAERPSGGRDKRHDQ